MNNSAKGAPVRLAKTDFPVWHFPLSRPHTGPMLGNSSTGLMVWGEGAVLQLTFGSTTLWDHDGGAEWSEGQSYGAIRRALEAKDEAALKSIFPPTAKTPQLLPVGRLELTLPEGLALDTARLDTRAAFVEVRTRGRAGRLSNPSFRVVLDRATGAVAVALPAGLEPAVRAVPAWENPIAREQLEGRGFAPPTVEPDGFAQPLPHDPAVGLAFVRAPRALFAAARRGGNPLSVTAALRALDAARAAARAAAETGADALFARTAEAWAAYWVGVPRLDLPNPTLQYLWELGMYKFGGATADPGEPYGAPCPLQGPWYEDYQCPPWGGDYHFNINVQECYWPAYGGNALERLRPIFELIFSWEPRLRHNAKVFVGIDDGVMLPHAVDDTGKAMSASFWTGMMDHGSTMWMADMMWQYVRYGGGDRKFVARGALPFMKGAFNVFWAMLERTPDGALRLPVGTSPEFRGASMDAWGANASFQLAAAHRLAEDLQDAAARLREEPDPRWAELLEKLPKAALVPAAGGFRHIGLWDGLDLVETHRHHSHLASIFPFDTIDCDDEAWRKIVNHSYGNWMWRGYALWTGWCMPWASILQTRVGNADMAELLLEIWERAFTNEGYGTLHDTRMCGFSLMGMPAAANAGPAYPPRPEVMQLDAGEAAATAILQMLLLEKRGVLHLFRGAPARWLDVAFDGIRAPGGVLVSASRKDGAVGPVTLRATAGAAPVRLASPWPGAACELVREDGTVKRLKPAAVLEIRVPKGGSVVLRALPPTA